MQFVAKEVVVEELVEPGSRPAVLINLAEDRGIAELFTSGNTPSASLEAYVADKPLWAESPDLLTHCLTAQVLIPMIPYQIKQPDLVKMICGMQLGMVALDKLTVAKERVVAGMILYSAAKRATGPDPETIWVGVAFLVKK